MIYNDDQLPSVDILAKMNNEFYNKNTQVEVCDVSEYRQIAELEDIFRLLTYCEEFFKWLEGKDNNFEGIKELIKKTQDDKVTTAGCCGKRGLDYKYGHGNCDKDFNKNCTNYCKCEMEILDKIIKLLTLKNSIVDKECMVRLAKNRMDMLKLIFGKYCR